MLLLYTQCRGVTCHDSQGAHLWRVETRCTEKEKKESKRGECQKTQPWHKCGGTLAIPCRIPLIGEPLSWIAPVVSGPLCKDPESCTANVSPHMLERAR